MEEVVCLKFIGPEIVWSLASPMSLGAEPGVGIPWAALSESSASGLSECSRRSGESMVLQSTPSAALRVRRRSFGLRLLRSHPAACLQISAFGLLRIEHISASGHLLILERTSVPCCALLPALHSLRLGSFVSVALLSDGLLLLIHTLLLLPHLPAAIGGLKVGLHVCIALNQPANALKILCLIRLVDFIHETPKPLLLIRFLTLQKVFDRLLLNRPGFRILTFGGIKNQRTGQYDCHSHDDHCTFHCSSLSKVHVPFYRHRRPEREDYCTGPEKSRKTQKNGQEVCRD